MSHDAMSHASQIAAYIACSAGTLCLLARYAGLKDLVYLLRMVEIEAHHHSKDPPSGETARAAIQTLREADARSSDV